jgi:hypothetical protein
MTPPQGTIALRPRLSASWITGSRYDLLWFILPGLSGYAAVYAYYGLGVSWIWLWWFWVVVVDGPHVFGTLWRTFLDAEEWRQRRSLLLGSLWWFLPGPLMVTVGALSNSRLPYLLFLMFAGLWAYWHVVRQHYGFMVLYQKKNGEPAGREGGVDYWCFYVLMCAPFLSMTLRNPEAREALLLGAAATPAQQQILALLHGAIVVAALVYAGKELARCRQGLPLNLPKNLFLLSCVPLHLVVFLHPVVSQSKLILFSAFVTLFHNFQYHGIVWFYGRNRYGRDHDASRYGFASRLARSFWTYYAAGLLFTVVCRYTGWTLIGDANVPMAIGPNLVSRTEIGSGFTVSELAFGLWWGFALSHYWLDQKIWRTSKDRQLNRDLKLA